MSIKEKLMDKMMSNQFGSMTTEEKQQMMDSMMDNFFSSMSEEEKKEMMASMMPKMMENMMGSGGGNPMMNMMGTMMGGRSKSKGTHSHGMPWEKCSEMMSGFSETANTAKFATPELRNLFDEWCAQIENEILEQIKNEKEISVDKIAKKINLSEESVKYLLGKLAQKGLIDYKLG